MGKGIRSDLKERLFIAHERGECIIPVSRSDSRRLERALKRGELISPAPAVYALPRLWKALNPLEQESRKLYALAKLHPTWVFASYSAAVLHGLDVSYSLLGPIHLACDSKAHSRSTPIYIRHVLPHDSIVWKDGVLVTSIERTVFDCTRTCSFPRALGIADSALRVSGLTKEHYLSVFNNMHGGHRNKWRTLQIMDLANGKAENGGESFARAVMIRESFRVPELQVGIRDPIDVSRKYRVDFYWRLRGGAVAGELDGNDKYVDPQMTNDRDIVGILRDERLRESHITGAETKVMRFSFSDVLDTSKFCHLMSSFGIPDGYPVPEVART